MLNRIRLIKGLTSLLLIVMAFSLPVIFAQDTNEKTFADINEPIMFTAEKLKKDGTQYVFDIIAGNISYFEVLNQKAKETDDIKELLGDLATGFDKLQKSYSLIVDNRLKIEKTMLSRLEILKALVKDVDGKIREIEAEMTGIEAEKAKFETEREKINDVENNEYKKLSVLIRGLESELNSLSARKGLWEAYKNEQNSLRGSLVKLEEGVELFLTTIVASEGVYKQAYRTIKLTGEIINEIKNASNLKGINDLSIELLNTFDEVDEIINKIKDIELSMNEEEEEEEEENDD